METNLEELNKLADLDIHIWLKLHNIKNEDGKEMDFRNHLFLVEPYEDTSKKLVVKKAAQIGFSTMAIFKSLWMAKNMKLNIIYTLPTFHDIGDFVSGKVNRIIGQNSILQEYTKDKDSIEQKQVGENVIYYRGTWTEQAALMVSADLLVIDEYDRSKQAVVDQYASRLQHSNYQGEWYFSNPSAQGSGVDRHWANSTQKHWFIRCDGCKEEQYMSWPESVDPEREVYQCKHCQKELSDEERRVGRWVKKYNDREFSGYWIPLLIAPWVSAKKILEYYKDKTEEYFYNFVLGDAYVGGGNKLTWPLFSQNLTSKLLVPKSEERMVLGIDTGLKLDYVMGGMKGLFYHGEAKDYDTFDNYMKRWPKAIAVVDGGGDLIGSRKFQERWPGRVYLGFFRNDRKTQELVTWGEGDNFGTLQLDRERMIQLVVDEFRDRRVPVQGTEGDWQDYWSDWNNLTRIKVLDPVTQQHKGFKWVRNGRDHRALATTLWRAGIMRFGSGGFIADAEAPKIPPGLTIDPITNTVSFNPDEMFKQEPKEDWRD